MVVVTVAEKLGDWRVAWMCSSISAGICERDWFSKAVTAARIASFGDGLLVPNLRVRAATSAWRLRRSLLSADMMGVDSVVSDEILGWLLGWMWGPFIQLLWYGCGLVEACGLHRGPGISLGCCLVCRNLGGRSESGVGV